jgi:hypothetical protein
MGFATVSGWAIISPTARVSGDSIRHSERLKLATVMEEFLRPLADVVAA